MLKLYETNSKLKENDTVIAVCLETENGWIVELEETIFFPTEGGQQADSGIIEYTDSKSQAKKTVHVLEGKLKDNTIKYLVDAPIEVGTKVHCILDWEKRFLRMQNHSGEHILSGLMHSKYGFDNVGFHLSDNGFVTLDINGTLTKEQLDELEREANQIVYSNLKIEDSYPDKQTLAGMEYRSKIEIEGQVRIITIPGVDVCACCAPHVTYTGEIGIIKIFQAQKYKGGTRISILCGERALKQIGLYQDTLMTLSNSLTTSFENVVDAVESLKSELSALRGKLGDFARKEMENRIKELPDAANMCIVAPSDTSNEVMKCAYNEMLKKFSGYVGVFVGDDETGYRYFAGGNGLDATVLAGKMKDSLNAKGGGNSQMVQGKTTASKTQIELFFSQLI